MSARAASSVESAGVGGGVGSGGRSRGGTDKPSLAGARGGKGGVEGGVGSGGKGGVGSGGKGGSGRSAGTVDSVEPVESVDSVDSVDSVGAVGAGGGGVVAEVEAAGDPSLVIVSSASLSLLSVAFWKISSSLTIVGKTLGRSGSVVLLTMSMRLILMGSLRGESISRLISACLLRAESGMVSFR